MPSPKRRYSTQEKAYLPKSGEIPLSPRVTFLQDRGWTPFIFDGEVKWIDPLKPYDVSHPEENAIDIQLQRDEAKADTLYSMIDKRRE